MCRVSEDARRSQQRAVAAKHVRKAEGEPFAVTLYNGILAGDVTVYRARRVFTEARPRERS